jgi:hypothetical protein
MRRVDWSGVVKTVGSAAVIVAVLGFFLRSVFQQILSRDLERFKAELSAKHDVEIERLRNDLRVAASERETRFTRLHDTRAATIAELYKWFVRAHYAIDELIRPLQVRGLDKKSEHAISSVNSFIAYFRDNRIYFEESLCHEIDRAYGQFIKTWCDMLPYAAASTIPPSVPKPDPDQWMKTWEEFNQQFPAIRDSIERCFRDLLGVMEMPKSNSGLARDIPTS